MEVIDFQPPSSQPQALAEPATMDVSMDIDMDVDPGLVPEQELGEIELVSGVLVDCRKDSF